MLHEKKQQQQQVMGVEKRRLGDAVVREDEVVQAKVGYIVVALVLHLWRVRNRDRLWNGGLGCARRQMVLRSDMLWAFKNMPLMFLF